MSIIWMTFTMQLSVCSCCTIASAIELQSCLCANCACADVEYRVEPREIKARLDSPVVQAVMKMGYSRDVIRKVIERRLVSTGKSRSIPRVYLGKRGHASGCLSK